jgi:hypothetical protein
MHLQKQNGGRLIQKIYAASEYDMVHDTRYLKGEFVPRLKWSESYV